MWGWWESSRPCIMWGIEVLFWAKISVLRNQGKLYQAAFEKGQRKKRCISSSSLPHLEHVSIICLEYLRSLLPVGSAFRRSLQAKVWTRDAICFSFHTRLSKSAICGGTVFGLSLRGSWRLLKQCMYALFGEDRPVGASFHTRMSWPVASIMGVWSIELATTRENRELIKFMFQALCLGSQRSFIWAG